MATWVKVMSVVVLVAAFIYLVGVTGDAMEERSSCYRVAAAEACKKNGAELVPRTMYEHGFAQPSSVSFKCWKDDAMQEYWLSPKAVEACHG